VECPPEQGEIHKDTKVGGNMEELGGSNSSGEQGEGKQWKENKEPKGKKTIQRGNHLNFWGGGGGNNNKTGKIKKSGDKGRALKSRQMDPKKLIR